MRVLANKNARLLQNLDKLSTREKLIYDQCIMKANAKSPKAARYKKAWIYDCLLLKIKSTAVYTFLHENEYLPLPNPRTLYTYLRSLKADFGFDSSLFIVLKDKLQVLPERERRGALMFNEMSCIVHLSNAGAIVDAVTCDNSTPNRSALRSLGVNSDQKQLQTSFQHPCDPSRTVQALIDPPHVFKCIRNNLQKVGKFLLPEAHEVHHFHYSALLEYEEQQAGLRAVPKLTRAHIFPNAFQKMSVRLAVQLFSGSTASAMEFYSKQEGCQKLHNSAGTYDFTKPMNDLFDCLNSRRPQDVQYNEAEHIATLKANIKWLDDCCTHIESLPKQRQVCFLSKPTCGALRITLHSMVALID
ncbi:hypothetical protein MRX96_037973 [Rhipicephalus microplus]